jgi:hypothetical protein
MPSSRKGRAIPLLPPVVCMASTESQCLYKGALYFYFKDKRFSLFQESRLALEPSCSPSQWVLVFFPRHSSWGMNLNTYLHLVLRLIMSGAIPLLKTGHNCLAAHLRKIGIYEI